MKCPKKKKSSVEKEATKTKKSTVKVEVPKKKKSSVEKEVTKTKKSTIKVEVSRNKKSIVEKDVTKTKKSAVKNKATKMNQNSAVLDYCVVCNENYEHPGEVEKFINSCTIFQSFSYSLFHVLLEWIRCCAPK